MYTPGTLFDGRYLLKERKGRGSFGEVWLATDQEAGIDFAIKIYVAMNSQGLDEFRKEYQLSCNLINSNLLHVNHMGVCQEDSCPYLVMPYCPKGSASMVGRVDEHTIWKFLHDVANGLSYLHNQRPPIIHQDIKPDNILQTVNGDFVITDFGISKQMRATMHAAAHDTSGAVAYMGPERFSRQYQTVKASDIWSLGATLYELATGQLPFEGRGGGMLNAGAEVPDLPPAYSAELNNVVRSCMARETWDRPSATQLADLADQVLKGGTPSVQAPSAEPVAQPAAAAVQGKSRNILYAVLGVVIIALVGFIAYMLFGGNDAAQPASPSRPAPTQPAVSTPAQRATPVSTPVQTAPSTPQTAAPAPAQPQQPAQQPATAPAAKSETAKPAATASPTTGSVNLGYATWKGGLRNGKPHGQGTMTFSRDYDLQGHAIKAGDTVTGECVNGKLSGFCKWQGVSGSKSIMLGE